MFANVFTTVLCSRMRSRQCYVRKRVRDNYVCKCVCDNVMFANVFTTVLCLRTCSRQRCICERLFDNVMFVSLFVGMFANHAFFMVRCSLNVECPRTCSRVCSQHVWMQLYASGM